MICKRSSVSYTDSKLFYLRLILYISQERWVADWLTAGHRIWRDGECDRKKNKPPICSTLSIIFDNLLIKIILLSLGKFQHYSEESGIWHHHAYFPSIYFRVSFSFQEHQHSAMLSNSPGGALIGAKIPDWMSYDLAGREK